MSRTVWAHSGRYDERMRVLKSKPEGRIGWGLEEVPVLGTAAPCAHAYVVEVTYTTGNTFGCESGLRTVACVAYTAEDAMKARDLIEENSKLRDPKYTLEVDGVEIYCGTWVGYFESIDYVEVKLAEVTDS